MLTSNVPDEKRLNALKYLVYLIGDVCQPLHAGYLDDKGGNKYQLQVFMRGSNLHALWSSRNIKSLVEDADAMTARLLKSRIAFTAQKWRAVCTADQSCQIIGVPGFYPERRVEQDYIDRFTPVLKQQLTAAGAALASILNQIDAGKTE